MKKLRTVVAILILSFILSGMTSCLVTRHSDSDNGRHRGWFQKQNKHRHNRGGVLIITQDNRNRQERHNNRR